MRCCWKSPGCRSPRSPSAPDPGERRLVELPARGAACLRLRTQADLCAWTVTAEDIRAKRDFGSERALAVIYNACWGNYMTRVSNGFQLRLERDNIFFDSYSQEPAPAGCALSTSER